MDLSETLRRLRENPATSQAVRHALSETFAELRRSGAADGALAVGDAFPDFLLPDAAGHLVEREDLLRGRGAVVTFFRGHWCPYCTAALGALRAALPGIVGAGATLTAVTPETGGRAHDPRYRPAEGFRFLADVDHGLAMGCGVAIRVPGPYRSVLAEVGLDLGERQGTGSAEAWFLPIPATFVLDRGGIVRWRFVDVDFTRRAEPTEIVRALTDLSG